ncbi:hypothetical protein K474DRAFT_1337752 [Panus rudis PR-1116 ss-1]|nr:hypothetical protein K474DRAFT_1337752 [Panus rudis PR-1116 ss-1]
MSVPNMMMKPRQPMAIKSSVTSNTCPIYLSSIEVSRQATAGIYSLPFSIAWTAKQRVDEFALPFQVLHTSRLTSSRMPTVYLYSPSFHYVP